MDETRLQMVIDAIAGMSVEEVESMIISSVNADQVEDPAALASYLVSLSE